mmetsp:Transcript_44726/g.124346  ORF Transcript_44726/g.124346 Transcript_44726/m.124346 type:complete len:399 (-) Transcript_44726:736-1932(-)
MAHRGRCGVHVGGCSPCHVRGRCPSKLRRACCGMVCASCGPGHAGPGELVSCAASCAFEGARPTRREQGSREQSGIAEGAALQGVVGAGTDRKLLIEPAEYIIRGCVRGALAKLWDAIAAEGLCLRARPTDGVADGHRVRSPVRQALCLRVELRPPRPLTEQGHHGGKAAALSANEPLCKFVQAVFVGHRGPEVLDDPPNEPGHLWHAVLVGNLRKTCVVQRHAPRVGSAERGSVANAWPAIHCSHGVGHWCTRGFVHHWVKAVDVIRRAEVWHWFDDLVRQAEHTKFHLRAGLPVCHLVLKERDAEEERIPAGDIQDDAQVLCLVGPNAVVFSDVYWRRREGADVAIEELVLQVRGRVLGVEAVRPPGPVGGSNVVARPVAVLLRIVHCILQLRHLA